MDVHPSHLSQAHLYLNGKKVGAVRLRRANNSWSFGDFSPTEDFTEFAPLFGRWSLIMHADDDADTLSRAASEELRDAEYAIDRLSARLYVLETGQWRDLTQLNIDGPLIEWKSG